MRGLKLVKHLEWPAEGALKTLGCCWLITLALAFCAGWGVAAQYFQQGGMP